MRFETKKESLLRRLCKKLSPKRKTYKYSFSSKVGFKDARGSCARSNSNNDIDELQMVFNYFDENGDGKISTAELQSCVAMLGGEVSQQEAEEAIKLFDLDEDNLLDFDEFQKLMEGEGNNQKDKDCELKDAFGMYTIKGTEWITSASLKGTLCRLGESKSLVDCNAIIHNFDLNGDGVLSFDEFAIMMR